MMDCNKDEAVRAKEIAERKFSEREYVGAKKFALKALNLYPALEDLSQFLTTLDIYISAENKISGEMDWYGILGVSPFADDDTVRKQYRKLALTLHPDKNKSLGAEGAFKLVSEAWSLLSDKTKRLAYNQKRTGNTPNHVGSQSNAPNSNGFYNFKKNVTSNVRTGNNNARAPSTSVPPPHKKAQTFWTICNRCRTHYEYLRVYLNHTLLCPNCNEAFVAAERGPPPNVFKSPNWSSRQQHQNSQQHAGSNNTNLQWGSASRGAGFGSTDGSSSVAAQAASVVQQASEKVRREGAPSITEWERSQMSKRTDVSKKRRMDDIHINGYQGHMANHMGMGHGAAGVGCFSESGKANMETGRIYGFSGNTGRHNSLRELSMFELRKMLMDKARIDIRNKLQEWTSVAEAKITNKDRENKRQKSTFNGKPTGSEKHVESTVNGNKHLNIDSLPVTSDDTVKKSQTYVTINVPDPDFHNFDLDRAENSFEDDQVWAAYDDDDGMPRYYARIHKVISTNPFRMRISWLNSRSNSELGPIDWIGSGFYKTCGDFRAGKHEISESLNSFSHKVRWTKGTRGVVRIFPGKGEVWALYRNWSPDWNEHTPDEVIHKYDMVEVLEDFSEEQGILVTPLVKVAGFRTVFRRHMDQDQVRRIPKEEMFRFSHQVPNYLLTGQKSRKPDLDPFHALVLLPPRYSLTPIIIIMTKQHANWSPYDNNGGSCVAIAGADYCVIAADTRMSTGYNILTREYSKISQLADKCVMASSGFQADVKALQKQLSARHLIYQHQHNKQMSCPAMAQLLSNTLYYKRFFPYYAFNVLGGLDNEGKGCVFTYDAVGSYERVGYSSQGSGFTLIMPFLDNQLKSPSPLLLPAQDAVTPLSEAEAIDLVKTVFASATERDIYTGDKLEVVTLNASGIHREYMELRKD